MSNFEKLENLFIFNNQITDISPLSDLLYLTKLNLSDNQITDIITLVNNTGIDSGDEIWLGNNPLSDTSINTHIPQLQARNVTVNY